MLPHLDPPPPTPHHHHFHHHLLLNPPTYSPHPTTTPWLFLFHSFHHFNVRGWMTCTQELLSLSFFKDPNELYRPKKHTHIGISKYKQRWKWKHVARFNYSHIILLLAYTPLIHKQLKLHLQPHGRIHFSSVAKCIENGAECGFSMRFTFLPVLCAAENCAHWEVKSADCDKRNGKEVQADGPDAQVWNICMRSSCLPFSHKQSRCVI